jgi:hypothetical protein
LADVHYNRNQQIAVGCDKDGNICNFNNFIKYINELKTSPSITNDEYPDIHETASKLNEEGLTSEYKVGRILQRAKDVATLIKEVRTTVPELHIDY